MDTNTQKQSPAGQSPALAVDALLGRLEMPKRRDKWKKPRGDSPTAMLILKNAPKPDALKWYPDLPPIGAKIWGAWPSGYCGIATYIGAWTFRTASGYINELPVTAWHLA